MKIGIVTPNNIWFSPYVRIYTSLLNEINIDYEIISWNREGRKEEGIQFNYKPLSRNPIALLWAYSKFAAFVKRTVRIQNYDRLIVFTPQSALFISRFLKQYYRGKYLFDYRDLSLEQKPYFRKPFLTVLQNSSVNVISSPGFRKYLPQGFDYIISHNFNVDIVKQALSAEPKPLVVDNLSVLTIGAIRTDMNREVIDAFGNVEGTTLSFVGKGPASQSLEDYSREKGYKNITFKGYYQKEEEADIINGCNFINILYPQIPSHTTAVSNRFYNSLIYKRPMLVTKHSTQGDYAEKYNVGLAIENSSNLPDAMVKYLKCLDYPAYCSRCNDLLTELLTDYYTWRNVVCNFVTK